MYIVYGLHAEFYMDLDKHSELQDYTYDNCSEQWKWQEREAALNFMEATISDFFSLREPCRLFQFFLLLDN